MPYYTQVFSNCVTAQADTLGCLHNKLAKILAFIQISLLLLVLHFL